MESKDKILGAWKTVWKQVKFYTIATAGAVTTTWGIAEYCLEDYVRKTAIEVIEEKHGNQSFREILSDQLDVPHDIVPYYIVDKFIALDSLISEIDKFEGKYGPYLDFQLRISPMYRYLDEDGVEWWMGPDRRPHGILFDAGEAWCVYSNRRIVVGNEY